MQERAACTRQAVAVDSIAVASGRFAVLSRAGDGTRWGEGGTYLEASRSWSWVKDQRRGVDFWGVDLGRPCYFFALASCLLGFGEPRMAGSGVGSGNGAGGGAIEVRVCVESESRGRGGRWEGGNRWLGAGGSNRRVDDDHRAVWREGSWRERDEGGGSGTGKTVGSRVEGRSGGGGEEREGEEVCVAKREV